MTSRGQSELNVTDMLKHVNTYPDVPAHVLNVQEKDHSKICSDHIDMFKISWDMSKRVADISKLIPDMLTHCFTHAPDIAQHGQDLFHKC